MFQFPGFPAYDYFIHRMLHGSSPCGFPHSDICGSTLMCSSPQLFAACHVLLRLLMPRHSPCALSRLNSSSVSSDTAVLLLELCVSHLQLLRFFSLQAKLFLSTLRKDLISSISSFPFAFYFVCSCAVTYLSVCNSTSFLFGFQ